MLGGAELTVLPGDPAGPASLAPEVGALRRQLHAEVGLVFAARGNERPACVVVDVDLEGPWTVAQRQLQACTLRYSTTLTNARLQNRPVAIPAADVALETENGLRLPSTDLPAWALVLPLQPGGSLDGAVVLLTERAPSSADLKTLTASSAELAAKLAPIPQHGTRSAALAARSPRVAADPRTGGRASLHPAGSEVLEAGEGGAELPAPPLLVLPVRAGAEAREQPLEVGRAARPAESAPGSDLYLLLGALRDGVIIVARDGSIVATNLSGSSLLALLQPGEPGRLTHPALLEAHQAVIAGRTTEDTEIEVDAASRRFIELTAAPTPVGDTTLLVLKDVTEERVIHERLLQSEKMASIGQLVSGVAHELNNPLTGITGFAQVLLQRDLPADVRHEISTIYEEAERASRIVQNLLAFARRRRPEKERVDVNVLVDRVFDLRSYELRVHNIEPHVRPAADLAPVLADPHQIQQVLLNVIRNAEHAIEERGGRGLITCTTTNEGGSVRIAITDDGAGIRPENQRRIFDPFFTTKQIGEGTGLGLTISYGIVEEHGGHITVESQFGRGTTVKIELPASPDAPLAAEVPAVRPLRRPPSRSILVIDDEPSIRDLLTSVLLGDGHEVESAADGGAGLERLATRDFDLIITDVKMPGVDGSEFYRRVKAWDPKVASRIIFTTGDMVSPSTRDFLESVGNPYILKPFRLPEVRALVTKMLPR